MGAPWPAGTGIVGVLSGSLEDLGEQRLVVALGRGLARHDLRMLVADAAATPNGSWRSPTAPRPVRGRLVVSRWTRRRSGRRSWAGLPVVRSAARCRQQGLRQVVFDNRRGVTSSSSTSTSSATGGRRPDPRHPSTPDRRPRSSSPRSAPRSGSTSDRRLAALGRRGDEVAAEVLAGRPRPTAVFCLADSIACGAYVAPPSAGSPSRATCRSPATTIARSRASYTRSSPPWT